MAAHHYRPCHHHHTAGAAGHGLCYSSCCCSSAYTSCNGCQLAPHLSPDLQQHHALPAHLASNVHHQHPPPSPYPPHLDSRLPELHVPYDYLHSPYFVERTQTQPTVSALLRRIAALETEIGRRTTTAAPRAHSLRDAAARTIQAHFRIFLLRRSRTLGQLKQLASIKSSLGTLKSSLSGKTQFDFNPFYHKASNLQRRLDTIQGQDPLIRNGKIALSIELMEFLNFLESVSVEDILQSAQVKSRAAGNAKFRAVKRVNLEKLRTSGTRDVKPADEQTEETDIPIQYVIKKQDISFPRSCIKVLSEKQGAAKPASGKNVSFENKTKVYRIVVDDDDGDDDEEEEEEASHNGNGEEKDLSLAK